MKDDTWEILEQVGAYHFVMSAVPRRWFKRQVNPVELDETFGPDKRRIWWTDDEPSASVVKLCDTILIRGEGSLYSYGLIETVWEDKNHHRVDLWELEPDSIAELEVRVDTRYPYSTFLSWAAEFLKELECVVYLEDEREFVEPTAVGLYEALHRSNAARLADQRRR